MMYLLFGICVAACGVSIWQSATILKMAKDVKDFFNLTKEMDKEMDEEKVEKRNVM